MYHFAFSLSILSQAFPMICMAESCSLKMLCLRATFRSARISDLKTRFGRKPYPCFKGAYTILEESYDSIVKIAKFGRACLVRV